VLFTHVHAMWTPSLNGSSYASVDASLNARFDAGMNAAAAKASAIGTKPASDASPAKTFSRAIPTPRMPLHM
jgi:hypothetical protein